MKAFEPVKVENCKSCGSTIKQFNPDSLTVICNHCGTHSEGNQQTPKKNSAEASKAPQNPLLKLYETFEYKSKTWQIIGCIRYQGKVREWDSEDDTWETNPWRYNSWWVINEARELAWFTRDSTGYNWSQKTALKSRIPENDRSYEQGSWEIVSAVGEFSYFPRIGGRSTTYERNGSSIEILLDAEGNKKEIEAFTSTPMDLVDLIKVFNKTDVLSGINRIKLAQKAILASIVCLLVGYFMLSIRSESLLSVESKPIQHPLNNLVVPLGEISLESKSLVQFKFWATLPSGDGSFDAELIIKDDKNTIVSQIPINFWRTSGRDSDGSWTESTRLVSPRLKLPENKKYQLSLKPSYLGNWEKINLSGQIQKNVASLFPLILGAILLMLLLIYQSISQRKFIRKSTGMEGSL